MFWDGARFRPFACEGGHADFAPHNEPEIDLLQYLKKRFGHVSFERVLSGPGLHNILCFLRDTNRGTESRAVAEAIKVEDPAAALYGAACRAFGE